MRPRTIIVAIFFVLILGYSITSFSYWFGLRRMLEERGWNASPTEEGGPETIIQVTPNGPASVLRVGDEVVAINGINVERSDYKTENTFRPVKAGDTYNIAVRREVQIHQFTLRRESRDPIRWILGSGAIATLMASLVFFVIGVAVFFLKPDDKQALLLALCLTMMASAFALPQPFEGTSWWYRALIVIGQITKPATPALFLHLFLVFPEPSFILRRFPRFERLLYVPISLLVLAPNTYLMFLWAIAPDEFFAMFLRYPWVGGMIGIVELIYLVSALVVLVLNYRRASLVAKRKLRIVVAGTLVALAPFVGWIIALSVFESLNGNGPVQRTGWMFVNFLLLVLPLSFAYAIVRHQVIPVRLIVRRGLQYLFARNALRVAIVLPLAGLLISIATNPDRKLSDILLRNSLYFYLLLLVAIALGLVFRRRLSEWIDRKFFRETYNQEKILRELTDDVKQLDSIPDMSKRVTERVNAALHAEQIYLFYREEGTRDLSLSYTSGGTSHELNIPEEFQLLRFMELQGGAQDFPFPPKINVPKSERDWLAQLGTQLIVPLAGTDSRLSGLLLLGPKKSEVPYTAGDRDLLESLAGQIAIVYENVRLKQRVDQDRKQKHEVLSRVAGQNLNLLKECPRCGACFDITALACANDGAELALSLPVERTIEGRYRLDKLVGKGGMGAVYQATDLRLHRKVAVKILTGSMFGNSEALRRFEREAQASARLHHRNIVTVHDYGLLTTEGAYLVMELIAGETLGARLKREKQVSPAVAAKLFEQILDGLQAAHEGGIVHRDLKPENVLLSTASTASTASTDVTGLTQVHLLDFGLAKLTGGPSADSGNPADASPMTAPGAVMGTFGYMSPEQLTGGQVDERSDLFSVGVMIVEALTGRRPFTGSTYHELLTNILQGTYHLPVRTSATERLDAALQKCLAKEPSARYATAAEMRTALIELISACPPMADQETVILDADTFIRQA
jgi:hypothetical protein